MGIHTLVMKYCKAFSVANMHFAIKLMFADNSIIERQRNKKRVGVKIYNVGRWGPGNRRALCCFCYP